jgi:hypothetical protein
MNNCDIRRVLQNHWSTIFNTRTNDHNYTAVRNNYRPSIQALDKPLQLSIVTGDMLYKWIQRRPDHKAGGLDYWTTPELKALPPKAWDAIALFIQVCERQGKWPQAFSYVALSMIPKTPNSPVTTTPPLPFVPPAVGGAPDQRGVGLVAIIYGTWSSICYRQKHQWRRDAFPDCLFGGRTAMSATQSEILFDQIIEQCRTLANPFCAALIDRS